MRITLTDRVSFPVTSKRTITDKGYLQVPGRVARIGIQQYLATELGLTDRPANQIVNVYRPPDEVFKPESLQSFDNTDITEDHPEELVSAENFKEVVVGQAISGGVADGDYVVVDLLIKDAETIKKVEEGKSELSAGYSADYVNEMGTAPDGTPFEFVQRNIDINHIALCDNARAGHNACLFDSQKEVKKMPQVILDSNVTIEVADEATKSLIHSTISRLKETIKSKDEEIEELEKEKSKAEAEKDAAEEEANKLKEKSSDDAIKAKLAELLSAKDAALKIAGKDFACNSADPLTIKRKALDAAGVKCKRYESWHKAPDSYVNAYFDSEEERKQTDEEEEEKKKSEDSWKGFANDFKNAEPGEGKSERSIARRKYLDNRYGKKVISNGYCSK